MTALLKTKAILESEEFLFICSKLFSLYISFVLLTVLMDISSSLSYSADS